MEELENLDGKYRFAGPFDFGLTYDEQSFEYDNVYLDDGNRELYGRIKNLNEVQNSGHY